MAEGSEEGRKPDLHGSAGQETAPRSGRPDGAAHPHDTYLKFVQIARKAVAIAMAVFGAGLVICVNLDPRPQTVPESWAQRCGFGFLVGICVCFAAVVVLIIEHLARPARPKPFTFSSLLLRFWLILTAVFAIGDLMAENFGAWQAIGAMAAGFLLLSAVRERGRRRFLSAFFAAVMLGLTILGTQSSYQYARRHAEEIVAAGGELMDRVPEAEFHRYNPHSDVDESGVLALFGTEIQPTDPRVPDVLRNLGARRIWVDKERVGVYVGRERSQILRVPNDEVEYQIYRLPHPDSTCNPVWGFKGKGTTKITDRLWTNDY